MTLQDKDQSRNGLPIKNKQDNLKDQGQMNKICSKKKQ